MLWDESYKKLQSQSNEHPLLMTESAWNPKEDREKLTELAFEKFDCPAFYLGRDAIMSS